MSDTKTPAQRQAMFKRWTVTNGGSVVECAVATPEWVQFTVNVMGGYQANSLAAASLARALNAARISVKKPSGRKTP